MRQEETQMAEYECLATLRTARDLGDEEIAHQQADEALCEFLIKLGFQEVVEVFQSIDKFYA